MPKLQKEFPIVLGFRTTAADAQKLAELARQTNRGQADVLRLLLRHAQLAEAPDIQFDRSVTTREDPNDDKTQGKYSV